MEIFLKFDRKLAQLKIDSRNKELAFVTNTGLFLRQALIPECSKKNIELPFYYFKYFDIINEFKIFSAPSSINDLNDIEKCIISYFFD